MILVYFYNPLGSVQDVICKQNLFTCKVMRTRHPICILAGVQFRNVESSMLVIMLISRPFGKVIIYMILYGTSG